MMVAFDLPEPELVECVDGAAKLNPKGPIESPTAPRTLKLGGAVTQLMFQSFGSAPTYARICGVVGSRGVSLPNSPGRSRHSLPRVSQSRVPHGLVYVLT